MILMCDVVFKVVYRDISEKKIMRHCMKLGFLSHKLGSLINPCHASHVVLISQRKHMLWVLVRSTLARRF